MNAFLWVTVLLCWGAAALLIVGLAYPDVFQLARDRDAAEDQA